MAVDIARAGLAEQRADADVLEHAEIAERAGDLEGAGDAELGDAVGRHAGDALVLEPDLAGGRRQVAGDQVEHRRLAGAVGADDAGDRAGRDRERDVADRRQPAEVLRQAARP